MRRTPPNTARPTAVAVATLLAWTGWCAAQAPATPTPERRPRAPEAPPAPDAASADPSRGVSSVREGSYLLEVKGVVRRDGRDGWWRFHPLADDAGVAAGDEPEDEPAALTLLPCTMLDNIAQIVESSRTSEFVFDLTGQVFRYRDRAYLLPTHAPRITTYAEPPAHDPVAEAPPPSESKSAESILRDVNERVGHVPRSPRSLATKAPEGLKEGSFVMWRRGRLSRERGGAWTFLLDADAQGGADPPLVVLPCLVLERMEEYAQQAGPRAPILLSGRVYRYGKRAYVLPSAFMVPRERANIRN